MTTREEISGWFDEGVAQGATHMIVVCDTFDWEDYPVYVQPGEDARDEFAKYHQKNTQKVMEIYALHLPKEEQLAEDRSFHFETRS